MGLSMPASGYDSRQQYLNKINQLKPSFQKPPKTRWQRVVSILNYANPLWWAWKGIRKAFNWALGHAVGRIFFMPPLLVHNQRDKVVPELVASEDLDFIIQNALTRDAARSYPILQSRVSSEELKACMSLVSEPVLTHDGAVLEHYSVATNKSRNRAPKDNTLMIHFDGRSRHPLHCLPERLLEAYEDGTIVASFAYRGLQLVPNKNVDAPISDHQYWLSQGKFKRLRKGKQAVYDGMAVVAYYLKQGYLPRNIFLDCYSMGGVGVIVAQRFQAIFKRFDAVSWWQDTEFLAYAKALFGREKEDNNTFILFIEDQKRYKLEFSVFSDRNYSRLSAASAGQKVITPLEKRGFKKLSRVLGWISWPFFWLLQILTKWEINVGAAYQALDPKLKMHTGLKPQTPFYSGDTMVHEFAALSTAYETDPYHLGYVPNEVVQGAKKSSTYYVHAALPMDMVCNRGDVEKCVRQQTDPKKPVVTFRDLKSNFRKGVEKRREAVATGIVTPAQAQEMHKRRESLTV